MPVVAAAAAVVERPSRARARAKKNNGIRNKPAPLIEWIVLFVLSRFVLFCFAFSDNHVLQLCHYATHPTSLDADEYS